MIDIHRHVKRGHDFVPNPVYWNKLTPEDQTEFNLLRAQFHQSINGAGKDRRIVTFSKELLSVLKYLDRDMEHREERCILTGICFAGPFICVNTRQLKTFLGRCKSSINGSFQQMGYVALRTKAKARYCIVSILHQLLNEPAILRQWTVRCASPHVEFCFLSSFSTLTLPEIADADYVDEKSGGIHQNTSKLVNTPQIIPKTIENVEPPPQVPQRRMTSAYSVECFRTFDDTEWDLHGIPSDFDDTVLWGSNTFQMTRSVSASLDVTGTWSNGESTINIIE